MTGSKQSSIVSKCLTVVDILASSKDGLSFTHIVERSGLVKSSAHRILSILVSEDLAEFSARERRYRLGSRAKNWAKIAWERPDLARLSTDALEMLSGQTQMNAALSVFDDNSILYLGAVDTFNVRFAAAAGHRAPLYCTAAGKVLLAHFSEKRLQTLLNTMKLEKFTEFTITDRERLLAELQLTRERGYGLSVQEEFFQVLGISAPVWGAEKRVVGAVSLWTLTTRNTLEELRQKASLVISTAEEISAKLLAT